MVFSGIIYCSSLTLWDTAWRGVGDTFTFQTYFFFLPQVFLFSTWFLKASTHSGRTGIILFWVDLNLLIWFRRRINQQWLLFSWLSYFSDYTTKCVFMCCTRVVKTNIGVGFKAKRNKTKPGSKCQRAVWKGLLYSLLEAAMATLPLILFGVAAGIR